MFLPTDGRRNVAGACGVIERSSMEAEEVAMTSFVRPTWLALAFVATAVPASAQTWVYESDYEPRTYESPVYDPRAYEPVVTAAPLALTPAQRTTIYRTIIPQGRGRGPIVREQIVTESVGPAPVVRERIAPAPVVRERIAPAPVVRERIAPAPVVRERIAPAGSAYAYAVGSRVADADALAPMPQAVVSSVPAVRSYRYMVINNRLLLVDPATGIVMAEVTD
jgi:hypothetical protein